MSENEKLRRVLRWLDYQIAEMADPSDAAEREYALLFLALQSGDVPDNLDGVLVTLARAGKTLADLRRELGGRK